MPVRFDTSQEIREDAVDALTSGAVRVPAVLSRAGVFSYPRADGSIVHEWRPEDEVLRADSMRSIEDVPVTIGHPPAGVNLENWQSATVGHVSAGAKRDDQIPGIRAGVVVSRKDAVSRVRDKSRADALRDLSPGYDVRIDETSGVVPAGNIDAGKRYDRVQRDIKYNHVALLPRGGGRQGAAVSLRLDGSDNMIADERADAFPPADDSAKPVPPAKKKSPKSEDGEPMTPEEKAKLEETEAKAEKEKARADALEAECTKYREAEKAAARAALESAARVVLGAETKFDAVTSDRAIREAVCKRTDEKFDATGKADAYVEARFDIAVDAAKSSRSDHAARVLGGFVPAARNDSRATVPSALDYVAGIVTPKK